RNDAGKTRQPSLLAGMLFDGDGNRMTPSHAIKKGTRYRYYVSRSLITKDRTETSAGLRIPAAEIEHLVSSRVHRWLLDPGSIYKSASARLADPSTQQRLVARAADLGKYWPQLPVARKRAVLAALIERIRVELHQNDIRLRPHRTDRGNPHPNRHPSPPASAGRATRCSCRTIARRERRRNPDLVGASM